MDWLQKTSDWLTGGTEHPYMRLASCMRHDRGWMALTITLDLLVAAGYVLIAYHWFRNARSLAPSPAKSALATMRNIFAFCGLCGYLFIPIKMFWPAWRLYDGFMLVLVFYTWRYALSAKNLRVIYSSIGRGAKLAEELAASREESRRKSFFLNAISHDLRTPLNGLVLNADLARLNIDDRDEAGVRAALDEIKTGARLTADLLDGLLEYARLDGAEDRATPADVHLDEVIHNAVALQATAARAKGLALTGPGPTGLVVRTDRLKLERVLNNLLSNAVKFTAAGSVSVEATAGRSGRLTLTVADTGVGIADEHRARLFDEFYQVENHERDRHKGFGLGLAICRRLADQLGATLSVDSRVGVGSRFAVDLPGPVRPAVRSAPADAVWSGGTPAVAVGP